MNKRKKSSGGQAIVMVTLALFAMCGMMGFAVDLGWSFFVQKQAQAAADGAAIASVQEAFARMSSVGSFSCPVSATLYTDVFCNSGAPTNCSTIIKTLASNLTNGCDYAKVNGFEDGKNSQTVTIASDGTSPPPTVTGVNVKYWVTVRAAQSVPQLFSSMLGRTTALVSAIATGAVVQETLPGSFYGLNEKGDYIVNSGTNFDYGVDVDISGSGSGSCPNGLPNGAVCASAGMYLSSTCNGTSGGNNVVDGNIDACTSGRSGFNYAGMASGSASVSASTIQINGGGNVSDCTAGPTMCGTTSHWSPVPVNNAPGSFSLDPTTNKAQPPLVASGQFGTCGVQGGSLSAPTGMVLGAYQYYSYHMAGTTKVPDGNPITINSKVTFGKGGGYCPDGTGASPGGEGGTSTFGQFVFYGGMEIDTSANVTFGAGQYVMAGQNNSNGSVFNLPSGSPQITGVSTNGGTMFLFTDPVYSSLGTSLSALIPTGTPLTGAAVLSSLNFGSVDLKSGNSASVTLNGIDAANAPSVLSDHNGFVFWQDRNNSIINYNVDNGTYVLDGNIPPESQASSAQLLARRVVVTGNNPSPALNYAASVPLVLNGIIYQPRGAWIHFGPGNSNINAALRIITGALWSEGGGQIQLLPTGAPILTFKPALIQ